MAIICGLFILWGCRSKEISTDYPIEKVPHEKVALTDNFWSERLSVNRKVTIPHIIKKLEETGRIKNFELAAAGSGNFCTTYPFDDTDAYKLIEAASYELAAIPYYAWAHRGDSKVSVWLDEYQNE